MSICCDNSKAFSINQKEYNYLSPVSNIRPHLLHKVSQYSTDDYYFIGTIEQFQDMKFRTLYLD